MTDKTPGWIGPRDPQEPNLNVGYADGSVANCTTHNMGDCPYHTSPVTEQALTDAEKLAALETYLKVLKPTAETLRAAVTADMGKRHVERVGAFLPDGTKLAAVGHSNGRKSVKVTDEAAALAWAEKNYPDEVQTVRAIRPAFLKKLLDVAASLPVGSEGLDPATGQVLPFIEVLQGSPYVTVTTTKEGVERMASLANGFVAMLEAAR
jgi:hypothetical protein